MILGGYIPFTLYAQDTYPVRSGGIKMVSPYLILSDSPVYLILTLVLFLNKLISYE